MWIVAGLVTSILLAVILVDISSSPRTRSGMTVVRSVILVPVYHHLGGLIGAMSEVIWCADCCRQKKRLVLVDQPNVVIDI